MPYVVDRLIDERIDVPFRHRPGSRGCLLNTGTQTAEGLRPRLASRGLLDGITPEGPNTDALVFLEVSA